MSQPLPVPEQRVAAEIGRRIEEMEREERALLRVGAWQPASEVRVARHELLDLARWLARLGQTEVNKAGMGA